VNVPVVWRERKLLSDDAPPLVPFVALALLSAVNLLLYVLPEQLVIAHAAASVSLGLLLTHLWGLSVLPAVFVAGFLAAPIEAGLAAGALLGGVNVAATGLSWGLFAEGDVPTLETKRRMARFLLLGLVVPLLLGTLGSQFVLDLATRNGNLSPNFIANVAMVWSVRIVASCAVVIPGLVTLAPRLRERGWVGMLSNEDAQDMDDEGIGGLAVLLIVGGVAQILLDGHMAWVGFGALALWAGIWRGIFGAILIVCWSAVLAEAGAAGLFVRDLPQWAGLATCSVFALLAGRTVSDYRLAATKLKGTNSDLVKSRSRLEALTHALPDRTWVVDSHDRVVDALGGSANSLVLGTPMRRRIAESMHEAVTRALDITRQERQMLRIEVPLKDGSWVEARTAPLDSELVLWCERDITARRMTSEQRSVDLVDRARAERLLGLSDWLEASASVLQRGPLAIRAKMLASCGRVLQGEPDAVAPVDLPAEIAVVTTVAALGSRPFMVRLTGKPAQTVLAGPEAFAPVLYTLCAIVARDADEVSVDVGEITLGARPRKAFQELDEGRYLRLLIGGEMEEASWHTVVSATEASTHRLGARAARQWISDQGGVLRMAGSDGAPHFVWLLPIPEESA